MDLTELFCNVDDFCNHITENEEVTLLNSSAKKRNRSPRMSYSEIITILIHFHQKHYRNFKAYYLDRVATLYKNAFPTLLSYSRFIQLIPRVIFLLFGFLMTRKRSTSGIYFVDSTVLRVCHIKREKSNRVFHGIAEKSKSTMGWFYGFKLHLVVNDAGEIISFDLTKGNVDDRVPVPFLTKGLVGLLFGDKGYIKQELFNKLYERGLKFITYIRNNMKNQLIDIEEKRLLRKRSIIETINDQLKNISQVEHSRHRSLSGFISNLLGGLTSYSLQEKKPTIYNKYSTAIYI